MVQKVIVYLMQYTGIAYENKTTVMWCKLIVENEYLMQAICLYAAHN